MPVPKAPLHLKNRAYPWDNDVGFPWQRSSMNTKPIAHHMEKPSNNNFRFGVLGSNGSHYFGSFLTAKYVRHAQAQPFAQLFAAYQSVQPTLEAG